MHQATEQTRAKEKGENEGFTWGSGTELQDIAWHWKRILSKSMGIWILSSFVEIDGFEIWANLNMKRDKRKMKIRGANEKS